MLRLFTTWYDCADDIRRRELVTALRNNVDNPSVDQVCVLREGDADMIVESNKLVARDIDRRPNFEDFFWWINELQGDDDLAVIANTDIWLDKSIELAKEYLKLEECWALARWDKHQGKLQLFDRNDSQDAWVFRGPLRAMSAAFPLGGIRCDNRLLYELQTAGYETYNPSFQVRVHHEHDTPVREYATENQKGYVEVPYRYIWPHNLLTRRETQRHNERSAIRLAWRIDPRQVEQSLPMRAWKFAKRGFKRNSSQT